MKADVRTAVLPDAIPARGAMRHLHKYIQGMKDRCLVRRKGDCQGLEVFSDADYAGMYKATNGEEKRSRTGIEVTYNGMTIDWHSHYQKCTGTEKKGGIGRWDGEDRLSLALSTCESETYAAADAAKLAMHYKVVCDELQMEVPESVPIVIDASAAEGFINNTTKLSRMKHIDIRETWVRDLRDRDHIRFIRKPGTENRADFFTKILTGKLLQEAEDRMMGSLDEGEKDCGYYTRLRGHATI